MTTKLTSVQQTKLVHNTFTTVLCFCIHLGSMELVTVKFDSVFDLSRTGFGKT